MDWIKKISDAEIKENGVSALANRPNLNNAYGAGGLTAKQLKEWFDQLAKLIIERQNEIIDKTDPNTYANGLPMDVSGSIHTLADFIAALKDGTLADEGLMVKNGEKEVSLASFLGDLVKDLSDIGRELSTGLAGKVDKITDPYSVYTTNKDGELNPVKVVTSPTSGAIPVYFGTSLRTGTPLSDLDAANMGYVDTNTPAHIVASMDTIEGEGEEKKEYVLRLSLFNRKGDAIPGSEASIDLPLEMAFVGAELGKDEDGNDTVVFTLQNGKTVAVGLSTIFDGKVDKRTDKGKWVYTTEEGVQAIRRVGTNPAAWNIPWFDGQGKLKTNAPEEDLDCVNKKTMDDGLAERVPILTQNGMWAYTTENGEQRSRRLNTSPSAWNIPLYGTNGILYTNDPTTATGTDANKACTNKGYVDGKVAPIASDVAILFDAIGGAIEYDSIDSKDNPVTVPSNVFPAATIDKIGTGIALVGTSILYRLEEIGGDVAGSINIDTVSITGDTTDVVTIVASLTEELHVGDEYSFCVSVVGGSYDSAEALNVADGYTLTTLGTHAFTTSQVDTTEITFVLGIGAERVSYDRLLLKFDVVKNAHIEGVPVASVKKGDETIYTVPEAIRSLMYTNRPDPNDALPVYGLAMSDTVYNYLDLEKKQYVVKCQQNFMTGELMEDNATIDVSAYLTDEDGEITVAAGDEILFVDADGNSAGSTVPSTITYIVKKGASE